MNTARKRIKSESAPRPSRSAGWTPSERNRIRSLEENLVQRRQEIIREIERQLGRQLSVEVQNDLNSALDAGDHSILDLAYSIDFSLLEMKNKTLKDVNEALRRLRDNRYGTCEECRGPIPEGRLKILPFARMCVACQEHTEILDKIRRKEEHPS